MNAEEITRVAHKIRGNPQLIDKYPNVVDQFSDADWLYLLNHRPNDEKIARRFNGWERLKINDLCDLLCDHSQLLKYIPDSILRNFKRGHWAKMVCADSAFSIKLDELGMKDHIVGDWCCASHWAEDYISIMDVRCAAMSNEDKLRRIANESAMNPDFAGLGPSFPYRSDRALHIQWLASVAKDFAEMSSLAVNDKDEQRAEEYSLIAQAANYQAQKMLAETKGGSTSNGSGTSTARLLAEI